jgi:hypothetical protein
VAYKALPPRPRGSELAPLALAILAVTRPDAGPAAGATILWWFLLGRAVSLIILCTHLANPHSCCHLKWQDRTTAAW